MFVQAATDFMYFLCFSSVLLHAFLLHISSVEVFVLQLLYVHVEFPYNWSFVHDIEPSPETEHRYT